jgi:phosphatidylserine decarboxylase
MWIEILLILFLFLFLFYFYFQREPRFTLDPQLDSKVILSPAYGTIYGIKEEGDQVHILIILNVLDVHVQYYPYDGQVVEQVRDETGKYAIVYELEKSRFNEKVITKLRTIHGDFVIQQIAGMFVRNIETTLQNTPENIKRGQKLGCIRFGSRVDLILPKKSKSGKTLELWIKDHQKVSGPLTQIGLYK